MSRAISLCSWLFARCIMQKKYQNFRRENLFLRIGCIRRRIIASGKMVYKRHHVFFQGCDSRLTRRLSTNGAANHSEMRPRCRSVCPITAMLVTAVRAHRKPSPQCNQKLFRCSSDCRFFGTNRIRLKIRYYWHFQRNVYLHRSSRLFQHCPSCSRYVRRKSHNGSYGTAKYLNNHPERDYLGASFASIQKIVPSGSFCIFLLSTLL
jgi:hypothetical protein